MRYGLVAGLLLAAGLVAAPSLQAQQDDAPAAVRRLPAPQVVNRLLALRTDIALTESQVEQLSALRATLRAERPRLTPGPRRLHSPRRAITSGRSAYRKAAAILTPAQQATAFSLLDRVSARVDVAVTPDPLVHHGAGVAFPKADQGAARVSDPVLHDTGRAPVELPQASGPAGGNPMTHH
jgi:hypothetical protein